MDKNKKQTNKKFLLTIGIIIVVLGVAFITIGILLFSKDTITNLKNEDTKVTETETDNSSSNTENKTESSTDSKELVIYENKEDVINGINELIAEEKTNLTVKYDHEENGCWYYATNDTSIMYYYCPDDPIIRATLTAGAEATSGGE
jgi:maltose-binding protein MalE